jgi:hypothetical protein
MIPKRFCSVGRESSQGNWQKSRTEAQLGQEGLLAQQDLERFMTLCT